MKISVYAFLLWMVFFPQLLLAQRDSMALFSAGADGYSSYRIPVLLTAPNGQLLAFCEGRKASASDAGDIDILLKRSADGGKTWSATQVVWDDGPHTCGNPCPVVDATTGVIWLLLTRNEGQDKEHDIIHKKATHTRTVWVSKSEDNGATWSKPADITATTKDPQWGWYATGPGIGIQLQHGPHKGRLLIPCDHSYDDSSGRVAKGPYEYGSHVIYSDDHGQSWQRGGNIRPKVNECQLTELADGKGGLLMSLRSYFGRGLRTQSVSQDGGDSWSTPTDVPTLADPICQASLVRYRWPSRKRSGILLFLNPDSDKRMNMTLKASTDDGRSWQPLRVLHAGPAAYSALAVLPNGDIGCLYEAGEKSAYSHIVFQKISKKVISHIHQQ
ncbi:sialidase-1 [Chitinophaga eiseniae]|uniref:exo-alpha-sialidase n=1 Tax=Chitinophaga eiseniae TaxID=634771 RepID=A0A1T4TVR7_9BACT|nr:sialidase family protein [Chitinophaga eiseniae]SKA44536.1 sialidase-1 [Chitinophaga eiseniae]